MIGARKVRCCSTSATKRSEIGNDKSKQKLNVLTLSGKKVKGEGEYKLRVKEHEYVGKVSMAYERILLQKIKNVRSGRNLGSQC